MIRPQQAILFDLATDLERISYGRWRFFADAQKRLDAIDRENLDSRFNKILESVSILVQTPPKERTQEDALMYSVRIRNLQ